MNQQKDVKLLISCQQVDQQTFKILYTHKLTQLLPDFIPDLIHNLIPNLFLNLIPYIIPNPFLTLP